MDKMQITHNVRFQRMAGVVVLLGMLLSANAANGAVDDPTATLNGMTGSVFGTTAQEGRFAAEVGTILQGGDAIETLVQSSASLNFSEGSTIALGESTKMEIAMLIRDQVTTARRSRVKLLAGRMRAELSAGHQDDGAAFSIETPNTLASVKFSHPIIDVTYDPLTDTTTIDAHTMDVVVTNLRTMKVQRIPTGRRGVIQGKDISISVLPKQQAEASAKESSPPADDEPQAEDGDGQEPGASEPAPESEPKPETGPAAGTDGQESGASDPQAAPAGGDDSQGASAIPPAPPPASTGPQPPVNTNALVQNRTSIREATSTVPTSVGTVGTANDGGEAADGEGGSEGGGETSENPSVGSAISSDDERQRRQFSIRIEAP